MTETQDSTDAGREKTVAELEAEARKRAQAQHHAAVPTEDIKPGQPEVNRLKKRSTNRLMTLGILCLAALIVLAWMGDWAFNHFMSDPAHKATPEKTAPDEVSTGNRRQGMGQATPRRVFQDTPAAATTTTPRQPHTVPPPVSFSKSMALAAAPGSPESSQGATLSRTTERSVTRGKASPAGIPSAPSCTAVRDASGTLTCPAVATAAPTVASVSGVQRITLDPDLSIPVDTYIPCTLQTRFVSDVAGRISCLISEDVYSASTHVRLIPAGTRARGVYKTGTLNHGQSRMFVMWTELRTPDGLKIPMVDSQVVGQLGEAGIDGWIDTHFWARFGNAMLLSTVQDVAAAAASSAPGKDRNTDYTENSRAAAAEMAKTALDNSINIPPTIYKNQGDIIGIMTGSDIDFSGIYRLKLK
ncbi:VirB10/TraB/TrbI family type IV secretion system protein [Serratia fonticola]|uniref:VirB10/TraB/TrbI family type IV secretion system protein n=1 Tax=Serratia fonticola TaxID=47917 RepID=UPI00301CDF3F